MHEAQVFFQCVVGGVGSLLGSFPAKRYKRDLHASTCVKPLL